MEWAWSCPSQPLTATPIGHRCPGPHGGHAEADTWRPTHQVLGGGPDPLLYRQCQHGLALPDPGLPLPCPPALPGYSFLHRAPSLQLHPSSVPESSLFSLQWLPSHLLPGIPKRPQIQSSTAFPLPMEAWGSLWCHSCQPLYRAFKALSTHLDFVLHSLNACSKPSPVLDDAGNTVVTDRPFGTPSPVWRQASHKTVSAQSSQGWDGGSTSRGSGPGWETQPGVSGMGSQRRQ